EQRNEVAPLQLIELHSVPASQGPITGYRIGRDQSAGSLPNFSTRASITLFGRSDPTGTVRLGADARQPGRLAQILDGLPHQAVVFSRIRDHATSVVPNGVAHARHEIRCCRGLRSTNAPILPTNRQRMPTHPRIVSIMHGRW